MALLKERPHSSPPYVFRYIPTIGVSRTRFPNRDTKSYLRQKVLRGGLFRKSNRRPTDRSKRGQNVRRARKRKADLRIARRTPPEPRAPEQFVCNHNPFAEPIVLKRDIRFGQICDQFETISAIPGRSFGEGSRLRLLNTPGGVWWAHLGITSRIPKCKEEQENSLTSQNLKESGGAEVSRKGRYPVTTANVSSLPQMN